MKQQLIVYFMVDDTLQPKFGELFECRSKLFDHANHNGQPYIDGHCFLSLAMSVLRVNENYIKYVTTPIGCKLYDKSKTKLELTVEMIEAIAE